MYIVSSFFSLRAGAKTPIRSGNGYYNCVPMKDSGCKPDPKLELDIEVVATRPKAFVVKNFLSHTEADHLILLGADGVQRSTTQGVVSTTRTSSNTWVLRDTDEITERIFRR